MKVFKYSWQEAYLAALTETVPEKLLWRVRAADDAMFERLLELEGSTGTDRERTALEDTLRDLRALRSHGYHFLG
jgi:hypothetical protein